MRPETKLREWGLLICVAAIWVTRKIEAEITRHQKRDMERRRTMISEPTPVGMEALVCRMREVVGNEMVVREITTCQPAAEGHEGEDFNVSQLVVLNELWGCAVVVMAPYCSRVVANVTGREIN